MLLAHPSALEPVSMASKEVMTGQLFRLGEERHGAARLVISPGIELLRGDDGNRLFEELVVLEKNLVLDFRGEIGLHPDLLAILIATACAQGQSGLGFALLKLPAKDRALLRLLRLGRLLPHFEDADKAFAALPRPGGVD